METTEIPYILPKEHTTGLTPKEIQLVQEIAKEMVRQMPKVDEFGIETQEYLTFEDVLLKPGYSEIRPDEANTQVDLWKWIILNTPFLSAAMDRVTEEVMAEAIAKEWGIGIVHKNMSIWNQSHKVELVKRSQNWIITAPKVLWPNKTCADAYNIGKDFTNEYGKENVGFTTIPITKTWKPRGRLIWLITRDRYMLEDHWSVHVKERMIPVEQLMPYIVEEPITTAQAYKMLADSYHPRLIIVNNKNEMKLRGMVTRGDLDKSRKRNYPNVTLDEQQRLRCWAAVWVWDDYLERTTDLVRAHVDMVVVDNAHGHSKSVLDVVKAIRHKFPDLYIMWWNIATAEGAEDLINAWVDAVKVGIWPWSICTTRSVTWFWVPQLFAVLKTYVVAMKKNIPIIADWGIEYSWHIVKALAAWARAVMMWSMFAGTKETPWKIELSEHGEYLKQYRWMGSIWAMEEGSADRYWQWHVKDTRKLVPEWVEGTVPYKWPVWGVIHQLKWWLQWWMWYMWTRTVPEMKEKARFIRISAASKAESHVHGVMMTKTPPNYTRQ